MWPQSNGLLLLAKSAVSLAMMGCSTGGGGGHHVGPILDSGEGLFHPWLPEHSLSSLWEEAQGEGFVRWVAQLLTTHPSEVLGALQGGLPATVLTVSQATSCPGSGGWGSGLHPVL